MYLILVIDTFEVIFYDGFKKVVQGMNVKPMPPELKQQVRETKRCSTVCSPGLKGIGICSPGF